MITTLQSFGKHIPENTCHHLFPFHFTDLTECSKRNTCENKCKSDCTFSQRKLHFAILQNQQWRKFKAGGQWVTATAVWLAEQWSVSNGRDILHLSAKRWPHSTNLPCSLASLMIFLTSHSLKRCPESTFTHFSVQIYRSVYSPASSDHLLGTICWWWWGDGFVSSLNLCV